MAEEKKDLNADSLEEMLAKALKDAEQDVTEAQSHVDAVKKKIENDANERALNQFSIMYQEALKVKGIARDRHIKLIRMIQDRVRAKEVIKTVKGGQVWSISPESIQALLEKSSDDEASKNDE